MSADLLSSGTERPARRLPRWAVVALAAGALAVAGGAAVLARPPAVPAPTLMVVDDGIGVTTSGVIVVSVELRDPGPGLQVRAAELTAAPVLQPPSVTTPERVAPGGTARLVAIVQPDCRALDPAMPAWQEASLLVRVADADGRERDVRLELRDDPVLSGRLAGLCGGEAQERGGLSVGFLAAEEQRVLATLGVDGGQDGAQVQALVAPGLELRPVDRPLPVRVQAGTGASLRAEVTVVDCAAVQRPPPGSDPGTYLWGLPEVELAGADGALTRVRPEPAAVSELYTTAVRRIVQNACDGPPR